MTSVGGIPDTRPCVATVGVAERRAHPRLDHARQMMEKRRRGSTVVERIKGRGGRKK
jgi:hypothetical protein